MKLSFLLIVAATVILSSDTTFSLSTTTTTPIASEKKRYDGEKVVRFPYSRKVLRLAQELHLDVWAANPKLGVDIRVNPSQQDSLSLALSSSSTRNNTGDNGAKVLIPNIQALIDQEEAAVIKNTKATWFSAYHSYSQIQTFLKSMASQFSSVVQLEESIGTTIEGRAIPLVKLSGKSSGGGERKVIWIQAQQHAREWIAGPTAQYVAYAFASLYGKNSEITSILDQIDLVIVPLCNPDGYEYSRSRDRLWRKNREEGYGVDMNRNWPDHWGQGGSSNDKRDETYMGRAPGSSQEVKALISAYRRYGGGRVVGAIDFHSYSELILRPYGWTYDTSPDDEAFTQLGEALKEAAYPEYVNQRAVDLYVASGGASDWFYGSGGSRTYGITIELPPNQSDPSGFVLPPEYILPVGKASLKATIAFIKYVLNHPLESSVEGGKE